MEDDLGNKAVLDAKIHCWLDALRDAESRLRPLLGTVSNEAGLTRALCEIPLLGSQSIYSDKTILAAIPANIAILDPDGVIVQTNDQWQIFARDNAYKYADYGQGSNYLSVCDNTQGASAELAGEAATKIRAVLSGDVDESRLEYSCNSPTRQRWFMMVATALDGDSSRGAMVMHIDITDRVEATLRVENNSRHLSALVDFDRQLLQFRGSTEQLLDAVAEMASRQLGGDGVAFLQVAGDELVCRAASGIAAGLLGQRIPVNGSLSGTAITTNTVLLCADTVQNSRCRRDISLLSEVGALLVSPLNDGGGIIGAIMILARRRHHFEESNIAIVELMATSLSGAIQRLRSTDHLEFSEHQYRSLFDNDPQPMLLFDLQTLRFLAINQAAVDHYGYSSDDFHAMTIADIHRVEDVERVTRILTGVEQFESGDWVHLKKDGSQIDVAVVTQFMMQDNQQVGVARVQDVTQQRQAERELLRVSRAQKMVSDCNEALFRAQSEADLLVEIANIAVNQGNYIASWVGFAEQDKDKTLRPVVYAGNPDLKSILSTIQLSWSATSPGGQGVTGETIRTGRAIINENISNAPGGAAVVFAQKFGINSSLSLPLIDKEGVFGVLALYSAETNGFPANEVALCQKLADNLAFGIEHLREVHERQLLESGVIKLASAVSSARSPVFFQQLAASVADTVGVDLCILARILPGESLTAEVLGGTLDGERVANFCYSLAGTPSIRLVEQSEVVIKADVCELYPESAELTRFGAQSYIGLRLQNSAGKFTGILIVVDRSPLERYNFVLSTLRVFAARAAAELERQEVDAHYYEQAALLDKAHDAIVVSDLEGRISYWNKAAERLYGWCLDEARGCLASELILVDPEQLAEPSRLLLDTGEWVGRLLQRRKDGNHFTVEAHWSLVRDEEGTPTTVFGINTDITERLTLEEQLRQSQRLESLGQLTGGVAHDFNNLLTVIQGNAELLEEELEGQQRLGKLAEMIRKASQRGAELTHRLLAIARRQALKPMATDVNRLLHDMGELLVRTFDENIQIQLACPTGVWMAMVDPSQLESAVLNLCINSRDAMPDGGKLTIETANCVLDERYVRSEPELSPGEYLKITISDTGAGVSHADIDRIFDPFFTTKEKGKGTGLGLSMVYGFIKQSRGHIDIDSAPGLGTAVKIFLPRAEEQSNKPTVQDTAVSVIPVEGGETILLVEDEEMVRALAHDLLRGAGYRVLTAENGATALACLKKHSDIDLLFTDVLMPGGMNGLQLAEKALLIRPSLKVLYASGYTEDTFIHHGRLDPDVQLLNKPYRQTDLLARIRQVLTRDSA